MEASLSQEWLELEKQYGGARITLDGPLDVYQTSGHALLEQASATSPRSYKIPVKTCDKRVNENVVVRVYTPNHRDSQRLPLGVFSHGGGYCAGSLDSEDGLCRVIASEYPCILISVEYRLGPQHKLPTQFQDVLDAFIWTYDNATALGGDQSRVFCLGCSAGGSLSLGAAQKLIELGRAGQLKGVINCAGGTVHENHVPPQFKVKYKAMEENNDSPIINSSTVRMIYGVSGADEQCQNPWVFPLLSEELKSFPPTYLVACGADPLRDDNIILQAELERLGVPVKMDFYKGLPHIFWIFSNLKSSQIFLQNLLQGIKFILDA